LKRVNVGARGRSQTANSDPVTISTGRSLAADFDTCPFGQFATQFASSTGVNLQGSNLQMINSQVGRKS
jgi:hypothetical protein